MPSGTPNYELQLIGDQYVTDTSWSSTEGFAVYPTASTGTSDRIGYVHWDDVVSIQWQYGRRHQDRETRGGTMQIVLKNSDWKFTPDGGGTFANAQWLKTPVCISVAGNTTSGNTNPQILFNGEIIDYHFNFPTNVAEGTMTIIIGDRLTVLGNQTLTGSVWALNASTEEALNGFVTTANCGQSSVDVSGAIGEADIQAFTANTTSGNRAGDLITRIANTEQGEVTIRNGSMYSNTMGNRILLIGRFAGDVSGAFTGGVVDHGIATFDDQDADSKNFESLELVADAGLLVNRASYTRIGGSEQVYTDSDSVDEFRAQGITRSNLYYTDDSKTLEAATRFVNFQREPTLNVASVKRQKVAVGPPTNTNRLGVFDTNTNGLLTSTGSRVTVNISKPETTDQISFAKQCVGVRGMINRRYMQLTYDLANSPIAAFVLDSPILGQLDDDRLG